MPAKEDPGNKGSDFFGSGPGFTLADIKKQSNESSQDDKQTAKDDAKAAAKVNTKKKEADPK